MTEKDRYPSLDRVVGLLARLMKGESVEMTRLARRWGVSDVTVRRHVAKLRTLSGVRLRDGVLSFDPALVNDPASFPLVVASCFGAGLASLFVETTHAQTMRDAVQHLVRQSRRPGDFADIDRKFLYVAQGGEMALPDKSGDLDDLVDAVLHRNYVSFQYEHFDQTIEQVRVAPLSIAVYQHQIYIIGRNDKHAVYPYRLSRVGELEVESPVFEYPSRISYDPDLVFRDALGIFISDGRPLLDVSIRLSAKWRVHARTHRWHRSQRVVENTDGSVTLRLSLRDCPELEMLVLSFGEHAEVLAPPDLRERLANRVRDLAKVYAEPAPLARATPQSRRRAQGRKK